MATETSPLRSYFARMREIRGTGGATAETSYYSALETLLLAVGDQLSLKVVCNGQIRNQGAGSPDFGLYTRSQIKSGEPRPGQLPERGVVEVKGLAERARTVADGEQGSRYFNRYRLVLITNYREFLLIGEDDHSDAVELEFFELAPDEASFWSLAHNPAAIDTLWPELEQVLRRMMMTGARLHKPEDVAWFLASYAKDALRELESRDQSALAPLRDTLEQALGIRFEQEQGLAFFRSTLVQTLFYGVFSSWVSHVRGGGGQFNWHGAAFGLSVPMVAALFEEIARPTRLRPLGITDALDRATAVLNRVNQAEFLATFDTAEAIQHFYEPFLKEFDPELRKKLGVWYTPPQIVNYMVERVDQALRDDLNVPLGLADPNVYVLDPCCGTGAYLIAVLQRIAATLEQSGMADALLGEDLKRAVQERIFGFELMPAPFVVAHWRVGGFLSDIIAKQGGEAGTEVFDSEAGERAAIYLTNALTGWAAPAEPPPHLAFPEFEAERDAAANVKQDRPILVVLGNPPSNAFAGVTPPGEEKRLVDAYKLGLSERWGVEKYNLDDLYVRFFRVAENRIKATGAGVVCFISNNSFTTEPSFAVMREELWSQFDRISVDNLNGDSRETGKRTPDGLPDPSAFSTPYNTAGIQVGTGVTTLVRSLGDHTRAAHVEWREFWGADKRSDLENSSRPGTGPIYKPVTRDDFTYVALRPYDISDQYKSWPSLPDLAADGPFNGLLEKRGGGLMSFEREALAERMRAYMDESVPWEAFERSDHPLAREAARHDPRATRARLVEHEGYRDERNVRYFLRPFEVVWAYYSSLRSLWNEPRPDLFALASIAGNAFLVTRPARAASPEGLPVSFTRHLGDNDAIKGHAYYFPDLILRGDGLNPSEPVPNISEPARDWLRALTGNEPELPQVRMMWRHALAVCSSKAWRESHVDGLKVRWPRVPLPTRFAALERSSSLGAMIADLVDPSRPIDGVTAGTVNLALRPMGRLNATDLTVTEPWGSRTKAGKVMPGRGNHTARDYTNAELEGFAAGASSLFSDLGLSSHGLATLNLNEILERLGTPVDIHLNGTTAWTCVPSKAWSYTVGGYQPIKKWLSYRQIGVLGRALTTAEAREVTSMVRRITALLLLDDILDANFRELASASHVLGE